MKNSRLLLIIPALLISSCGDAQSYGKKITLEKAKAVYEDIEDNYELPDGWVVDFVQETSEGKGDDKSTQKMRYKAKRNATSLYINYRFISQSPSERINIHTEYYIFPDSNYRQIVYAKSENLITEQKTEIAVADGDYYSYSNSIIYDLNHTSEFYYATQYNYVMREFASCVKDVDAESQKESGNNYSYYSSGKGNLTIKLNFRQKSARDSDYEDTIKGDAILAVNDYRFTKLTADASTSYGNKQTMTINYTYPKAVKIEPPEGWEDKLVGSSVSSTSSKSTW